MCTWPTLSFANTTRSSSTTTARKQRRPPRPTRRPPTQYIYILCCCCIWRCSFFNLTIRTGMIIPCPVAVRADHKHAHPSEVQEHAVLPAPHHLLRRLGRRRVEVQHLGSARPEIETVTVTVTVAVTLRFGVRTGSYRIATTHVVPLAGRATRVAGDHSFKCLCARSVEAGCC